MKIRNTKQEKVNRVLKTVKYKTSEKQLMALKVSCKRESDITEEDRKYYGAPEFRGTVRSTENGDCPMYNSYWSAANEFDLNAFESNADAYRIYCQDLFYRMFMEYPLPYVKEPELPELIAIWNQAAKDAGFPEKCIGIDITDNFDVNVKMSKESANEQSKAAVIDVEISDDGRASNVHPADDSEDISLVSDFVQYAIDKMAPAIAEGISNGNEDFIKSDAFSKIIEGLKTSADAIINDGELTVNDLYLSILNAVELYDTDKSDAQKAAYALLKAINIDDILSKLYQEGMLDSMAESLKVSIVQLIKNLNEKPLINSIADIVVHVGGMLNTGVADVNLTGTKEDIVSELTDCGDQIKEIAAIFRKDHKEDIQASKDNGKSDKKETAIVVTDKAKSDTFQKTHEEKREERKQKKAEKKAAKNKDKQDEQSSESNDSDKEQKPVAEKESEDATLVETSIDGISSCIVDEERYNGFCKNHNEFFKKYPLLEEFCKMMRPDQKVKFFDYFGLVRATMYTAGREQAEAFLYIDPAKIRPGYSIILPRSGSNASIDPLTDISCPFSRAKVLIQTNAAGYTQQDMIRDDQETRVNMSFFEHIVYYGIPEVDRPYVISKLICFTDTLSSMGLCLRFKVTNYKSRNIFTLLCDTKVGLSRFAKDNPMYNGLEIDVKYGEGGLLMLRAHGNNAKKFADRVNKFTGLDMIDIELTDADFERADKQVAERMKIFGNSTVNKK